MLFRRLALAGAIGILAGAAFADGLRPPRELPPAGFKGQQYTDSGGCVFLKAGLAGRTNWVPRVGADRRQLCGYPPTFSRQVEVAVAEEPAPRPAPAAKPAPTPAPVAAAPAPVARPATAAAPAQSTVRATRGCPASAPYGQRARRADGTTALFCASSEARLATALAALEAPAPTPVPAATTRAAAAPATAPVVPPVVPGISTDVRIVCPAAAPNPQRVTLQDGTSTILCAGPDGDVQTAAAGLRNNGLTFAPVVPPGYRFAWEEDGRLNPRRGQGTVAGQMAQDQIWTRDVPARLVTAKARPVVVATAAPSQVTVSSSGGPQATGRLFVQVGSFGVAANAAAAARQLAALGLPVMSGKGTIKGKPVQVVSAGPFASVSEAQAAMSAARRAGFSDAFIR